MRYLISKRGKGQNPATLEEIKTFDNYVEAKKYCKAKGDYFPVAVTKVTIDFDVKMGRYTMEQLIKLGY